MQMTLWRFHSLVGYFNLHLQPARWLIAKGNTPAKQGYPFGYAQYPEVSLARELSQTECFFKPRSVICNQELQHSWIEMIEMHPHGACIGVFGYVIQTLLYDTKER